MPSPQTPPGLKKTKMDLPKELIEEVEQFSKGFPGYKRDTYAHLLRMGLAACRGEATPKPTARATWKERNGAYRVAREIRNQHFNHHRGDMMRALAALTGKELIYRHWDEWSAAQQVDGDLVTSVLGFARLIEFLAARRYFHAPLKFRVGRVASQKKQPLPLHTSADSQKHPD